MKHKRNKNSAVEYSLNYLVNNYKLCCELNDKSYKIGSSTCFCVTRPKIREIFAAIVIGIILRKYEKFYTNNSK